MTTKKNSASRPLAPSPSSSRGNFQTRLVSALVLIPVTLACAIAGGGWFVFLAAVMMTAMVWEWIRMSDHRARAGAYAFAMAAMMLPLLLAWSHLWHWTVPSLLVVALVAALERARRGKPWRAAGGLFYIGLAVLAILFVRTSTHGLEQLLYLLAIVWAADSAAYLLGSQVRGPKLWPAISPKKTWSGFAAGIAAGILAGGLVARLCGYHGGFALEVLSLALATVSVGGDLLSSFLKRRFGVKDTGTVIPGHGGVLDRLDALLAASLALAAFQLIFPGALV